MNATPGPLPPAAGRLFEHIAADPFAASLGIILAELRPGYSRLTMTVAPHMLNFHGTCHGGAVFSLADAAFAAAANAHGQTAVALSMHIQYLAACRAGQGLVAEGYEEDLGRKTGLYHITVRDQVTGALVASCQGRVYRLDREVL